MTRLILALCLALLAGPALATQIFITSGTSFTIPSDWNSQDNTIEIIGPGGNGGGPSFNTNYYGGGGGAYVRISNFSAALGASIPLHFGFIDCTGASDGIWFNSKPTVFAEGGYPGCNQNNTISPGLGGRASVSNGAIKFNGGNAEVNGAAGGAAGPNGAGNSAVAGVGGSGDAGHGGAGGTALGTNGAAGSEYGAHGSGGGGGSGAGSAGSGGASGGGGAVNGVSGVLGSGGLIIITYFPHNRISAGVF